MRRNLQYSTALAFLLMLAHGTAKGQGRYVRLQGQILSSLTGADAVPFHLDAYKITADSQRQLVRLSRFSGPDYHLYLEAGSDHEVLIQMLDHPPYLVHIEAMNPKHTFSGRLVLERNFVVPSERKPSPPITSRAPVPPEPPDVEMAPIFIDAEPPGLFVLWGDTSTVVLPVPEYPGSQVERVEIAFEEENLPTDFGHAIEPAPPVHTAAYAAPPSLPIEQITPVFIEEEELLPPFDYGPAIHEATVQVAGSPAPEVVATVGVLSAAVAPGHPRMLLSIAETGLPPAPRRVRLLTAANMVAGLTGDQQEQAIARLSKGQEIQVIEYTTPDWWMVAHGSVIGWVKARYME